MKIFILDLLFQKDGAKRGISGLLRFTLQHGGLFSTSRSIENIVVSPNPISVCFHLNKGGIV